MVVLARRWPFELQAVSDGVIIRRRIVFSSHFPFPLSLQCVGNGNSRREQPSLVQATILGSAPAELPSIPAAPSPRRRAQRRSRPAVVLSCRLRT